MQYTRNQVGGIYKREIPASLREYDTEFMSNLAAGVFSVLGIFFLCFSLVLVL